MPIIDIHDAKDVDDALQGILDAPVHERARRRLFIETLDFNVADILISLRGAACRKLPYAAISALPSDARRIAARLLFPIVGGVIFQIRLMLAPRLRAVEVFAQRKRLNVQPMLGFMQEQLPLYVFGAEVLRGGAHQDDFVVACVKVVRSPM